jgi:DNA polymerase III gamma/tau subunit
VREEDLHLLLGSARSDDLLLLAGQLIAGSRVEALATVDRLLSSGVALMGLLHQLIDHFRQLMLLSVCGGEHPAVTRLGPVGDGHVAQSDKAGPEKSLRICQLLLGAEAGIRHGVEGRLQLEMTCVRIAGLGELQDLDGLLRRMEKLERAGGGGPLPGR